ncbi:hypothetical protein ACFYVK_35625 [Streptomyces chartreusis]|uniref:hypothetical protein n=1 Tax=Streptomyces chartreusis TaxID=1969 RepID=UPI0036C38544
MEDRERMTVEELMQRYAVDPVGLDPAPAKPAMREILARFDQQWTLPCTACGKMRDCQTALSVAFPGYGPRWVDLCREHWLATMSPWRGPTTVEGIMQDLREVIAEVSAKLGTPARVQVWTDETGWQDEPCG